MPKEPTVEELEKKLDEYEEKIDKLRKRWTETKATSRTGDEYLDMQIMVYESMVCRIREKIRQRDSSGDSE